MKAAVFHSPKHIRVESRPEPTIREATDAILRVTATAICGSDLHIYNGFFPQKRPLILGHEFMGIVEAIGNNVRNLKPGDRVVVPFPIADGTCWFCRHGLPTACEASNPNYGPEGGLLKEKGGGLFGYTDLYGGNDGGQAEFVRVPFADVGPRKVPSNLRDEEVLFLTDIFPTGWTAVDWARVQPADSVAVFGCGPVGLMALKAARYRGVENLVAVDILPYRLDMARKLTGARTINAREHDPVDVIRDVTQGRGADVCIDAVGLEANRDILDRIAAMVHRERGTMKVLAACVRAARRGGRVSVVGVYGTTFDNFPLGQIFDKGIQLFTGQAPVHVYIDELLDLVAQGRVRLDDVLTHKLPLSDAARGYEIFNDKKENCVKVVLVP